MTNTDSGQYSPLISVCMPVYNAEPYVADAIEGILEQTYPNIELIICDNCSTDKSAEIARSYAEKSPKVRFYQNNWNIGFSGNAHKTTSLAKGDFLILHAADDIAAPDAFEQYVEIIRSHIDDAQRLVLMSDFQVIDQEGNPEYVRSLDNVPFRPYGNEEPALSSGNRVTRFSGHDVLRTRLPILSTFGMVVTVLFSRNLLTEVEGYISNQWINPDKHFMLKLLSKDAQILWVRSPLFYYRIHDSNQNSLQASSGVLKYLLDQYAYTFDLPTKMIDEFAGGRQRLVSRFVEHDCLRAALREIALGRRKLGFRHLCFGLATYPDIAWRNPKTYAAIVLWALGPLGRFIASLLYRRYVNSRESTLTTGRQT